MSSDIHDNVNDVSHDKSSGYEDAFHDDGIETVIHDNGTDDVEFDEETLVECNVTGFVDEEENDDDYPDTPVSSDCETEHYEKCSGELKLKQVFESLEEFKDAMVDYVLNEGWNVKFTRWGNEKSELKCAMKGDCPWRIYCSFEEPVGKWMIKVYQDEHRCVKNGYSKLLTQAVIAKLFLNDIRSNPKFKPKVIQEQIQQRWNLIASRDQCRKAKAIALDIIQKEHDGKFARLQDYQLEITDSTPDSSVEFHEERSKKDPKRKKGVDDESPKKKYKVTREGRIVRCGRCGIVGHNSRKCSNVGVEYIRPKNRNALDEGFESMAVNNNEGPSQST